MSNMSPIVPHFRRRHEDRRLHPGGSVHQVRLNGDFRVSELQDIIARMAKLPRIEMSVAPLAPVTSLGLIGSYATVALSGQSHRAMTATSAETREVVRCRADR